MLKKFKTKQGIKKYKKQIISIEQKRARSQAALVDAILTHTTPSDEDVDYFNKYTAEIEELRKNLNALEVELKYL